MRVSGATWLEPLFCDDQIASLWSSETQWGHFIAIEQALTRAVYAHGLVSKTAHDDVLAALADLPCDSDVLRAGMAKDGVALPSFLAQISLAPEARPALHYGATSQDIHDTAQSLVIRSVSTHLHERLNAVVDELERLKKRFGTHIIMGRTRMQAAYEIKLSQRLDAWHAPLRQALQDYDTDAEKWYPLQFGGPVGDARGWGDSTNVIVAHMCTSLGLATPKASWHSTRQHILAFGHWLTCICGALGKIGQDVALMCQQGIDEVTLAKGGASSAMPHKLNPVQAELLVTLAKHAAGLQGTLYGALLHEQERSGSAWMLEWRLLPQLCETTGAASRHAQELLNAIISVGREDLEMA